jgi:hypothetical protein
MMLNMGSSYVTRGREAGKVSENEVIEGGEKKGISLSHQRIIELGAENSDRELKTETP